MTDFHPDIISKYAFLWDGSDPGWVVHIHHEEARAVRILLPPEGIGPHFLKTLRNLFPEIARDSPAILRSRLESTGGYDCGLLDGAHAYELQRKCAKTGFCFASEDRSRIIHRIINERRHCALIIEDSALAALIGEEAMRHGVPARHSTN